MAPARSPESLRDALVVDLALIAVVVMWASTFVTFKIAWREVDPVAFTGVRFAAMVVAAVVVLLASRSRRPRRSDLPLIAASGLTGFFVYQMGFVVGLDRTSAVASAILISTHPMFAVVFSWISGRERPKAIEVGGVLLGFAGVVVFLGGWNVQGQARLGDLLSLGAAASFGAFGVINHRLGQRYPGREVMAYGLLVGGSLVVLVSAPALAVQDWGRVSGSSWLILVYAAVGPVYAAYGLWNWAIRRRGIARTVGFAFLVPVVGGVMAVVWLHERVQARQALGAAVVIAGLVVTRLGSRQGGDGRAERARIGSANESVGAVAKEAPSP
jgi:drug/metabolite transporter (DMT)-like permease